MQCSVWCFVVTTNPGAMFIPRIIKGPHRGPSHKKKRRRSGGKKSPVQSWGSAMTRRSWCTTPWNGTLLTAVSSELVHPGFPTVWIQLGGFDPDLLYTRTLPSSDGWEFCSDGACMLVKYKFIKTLSSKFFIKNHLHQKPLGHVNQRTLGEAFFTTPDSLSSATDAINLSSERPPFLSSAICPAETLKKQGLHVLNRTCLSRANS